MTTNINPSPVTVVQPQGHGGFTGQQADTLQRIINDLVKTQKALNAALAVINGQSGGETISLPLLFADPEVVPANFKLQGLPDHGVLKATSSTAAEFEQLTLNDIAGFDIADPVNGQVIAFIDGYWTNVNPASLGGITGGQNLGPGAGIWSGIDGSNLTFKSLVPGAGISIVPSADSIKIGAIKTPIGFSRQGRPGQRGAAGPAGRPGVPGKPLRGPKGLRGPPGRQGRDGKDGRPGPPGKNGVGGGGGGISLTEGAGIILTPSTITGTGSIAQDLSWSPTMDGNWTFSPTTGTTIFNGADNMDAIQIYGSLTADLSFGLGILAGTSSLDLPLYIADATNTTVFVQGLGDGSVLLGPITLTGKGVGTINVSKGYYINDSPIGFGKGATWNSTSGAVQTALTVAVDVRIPYDCTLKTVEIGTQGGPGSCTVHIATCSAIGSWPPATDITGGTPPAISSANTYANSTLSGWTTSFAAGSWLRFTLTANTVFTAVEIVLEFQ